MFFNNIQKYFGATNARAQILFFLLYLDMMEKREPGIPDIRRAATPPGSWYTGEQVYALAKEKIFARSWQYLGGLQNFPEAEFLYPLVLLPACLDEPLILYRREEAPSRLMSNVCTHRGFVLLDAPEKAGTIRCRYHGRCFSSEGKFLSMPEFAEAENFPSRIDDLTHIGLVQWHGLFFASLFPAMDWEEIAGEIEKRMPDFPFDSLQYRKDLSGKYAVAANWALYCDNYLEGFHIPYVHKSLNKVIEYGDYTTECFRYGVLQTAFAREGEKAFPGTDQLKSEGKAVAAYYYFIFPNLMLNFYPWGLSVNHVLPMGTDKTEIVFDTYVHDVTLLGQGAGSDLHRVEMEDEEVVESVQRGLHSRLYSQGRYSPKMERGVFHFHCLIREFMAQDPVA